MDNSSRKPEELYPAIEYYNHGWLRVSDIHELYYEESGNKDGNPIVYIHGGPGSACAPNHRRYFDPVAYRIILFDQRGAGKSKPTAELKENTTWNLVSDLEKLREHLGVDRWVVFGGSWGATLSLAYAQKHPGSVKALILRGIFTLRREELEWFYQKGASHLFPDIWESFLEPIPKVEHGDLMGAYYRRLTGTDEEARQQCALAWSSWEVHTLKLVTDPAQALLRLEDVKWALAFARIECHYFVHGGWFPSDGYLLDNVEAIRHIPATIVQGRYDVVTPMKTAWELHKCWPEAEFYVVGDAGHSQSELGTLTKLLEATDKYRTL